ncbi:MAG: hypothetical protein AUI53_07490 [Acidobacteria bacterium 13_1_40CM_2_60_7]|nr:MAG: hypothetical protein AUI53_07490 [Acidobacteria bacterium 13_1_40CM_2_60_7]
MNRRVGLLIVSILFAGFLAVSCGRQSPQPDAHPARPLIVFLSDFGTANDSAAICKGVIVSIAPDVRIMDVTHQVTPYSIEEGARLLAGVTPYYPSGTVFLAVVDPGVGTSRKAVIVRTKKWQYFVLPDNGLITPVLERDGLDQAREITNTNWMAQTPASSTFHGRDVFSPATAHLAAGWEFNLVGPVVPELVRLAPSVPTTDGNGITGHVIALDDPFGSLITDIPADDFKQLGYELGEKVPLQINKKPLLLPYSKTFMDVAVGEPLLYIDSRGRVGIAVNEGNYAKKFGVEPPATLFILRKGPPPRVKKEPVSR